MATRQEIIQTIAKGIQARKRNPNQEEYAELHGAFALVEADGEFVLELYDAVTTSTRTLIMEEMARQTNDSNPRELPRSPHAPMSQYVYRV